MRAVHRTVLRLLSCSLVASFVALPAPVAGAPHKRHRKPAPAAKPAPEPAPAAEDEPVIEEDEPGATEPGETETEATPSDDGEAGPGEDATEPEPSAPQEPEPSPVDDAGAQALQQQARDLRDRLFKARARVAIVGSKVFSSRLQLDVRSNIERFYAVTDLTITVDGAPVYQRDQGMPPTAGNVFEVAAAPGAHEVGIAADLVARRDQTYKVSVGQTFTVVVPENSTVSSRLVMRETGNMWRFAKRRMGYYRLVMKLRARAKANKGAKGRVGASGSVGVKGQAK